MAPKKKLADKIGGLEFKIGALTLAKLEELSEEGKEIFEGIQADLTASEIIGKVFKLGSKYICKLWKKVVISPQDFEISEDWIYENVTIPDLEAIVDLFLEMNGLKMKGETGPLIAMLKEMVPISLARSSVLGTESGGTSSLSPTPPTPSEAQKKN